MQLTIRICGSLVPRAMGAMSSRDSDELAACETRLEQAFSTLGAVENL